MSLSPQLRQYQGQVERMRRSPYMDWPAHVHLETQAICNVACNFCPYESLDRKGAIMDDALIEKVVKPLTH